MKNLSEAIKLLTAWKENAELKLRQAPSNEEQQFINLRDNYAHLINRLEAAKLDIITANQRIGDLCRMVNVISGNPKKARVEDYQVGA